jgi:hypothetical protein
MSFGESVFSAGFIQKTVKVDLDVRFSRTYPQRKQPRRFQKTREDTTPKQRARRRQVCRSAGPLGPTSQSSIAVLVLHRLLGYIYAIL